MTYIPRRIASSGSLTAGVPAAQYPAGSYAFRTSILVLALEPVVDNAAFVQSLARLTSTGIPGSQLRSGSISVGPSFRQSVSRDNAEGLAEMIGALGTIGSATVLSIEFGEERGAAIGAALFLAILLGTAIGSAANLVIPDHLPARWVTVNGVIDSPSSAVNTDTVTNRIASALNETLRLRVPRAPYAIIRPEDAGVGGSVIARTREDGACSGHRRFDKVIAAACTRLEAVAPQPVTQYPAPRPPAPQQPLQPQPVAPQPARPDPRPSTRNPTPQPVAPQPPYQPPSNVISPLWWVAGATAVAAAVILITTKPSR